jgi:hypothetical protein
MLRIFGRKNSPRYSEELGHLLREVPAHDGAVRPNTEFIAIPVHELEFYANKYIAAMETEESENWCKCLWAVHPDDQDIKKGSCRECKQPKNSHMHDDRGDTYHPFKGIRKRRVDDHPYCPVHSREGMVTFFFEWIFTYGDKT